MDVVKDWGDTLRIHLEQNRKHGETGEMVTKELKT